MTTTDRLIADRGHGLPSAQRDALRWLATDGHEGAPPKRAATWDALERSGLVTRDPEEGAFFGYQLSDPDGLALASRMGMLAPGRCL